jgi:hypothetical protein
MRRREAARAAGEERRVFNTARLSLIWGAYIESSQQDFDY